jgi:pseudouridine-5'-phosphate glycosidase
VARIKSQMGLKGGLVVANPIPAADALDERMIHDVISSALQQCSAQGIQGKAVTPYLLKTIVEKTSGQSLIANIALVKHNAKVGAQLAVAMAAKV